MRLDCPGAPGGPGNPGMPDSPFSPGKEAKPIRKRLEATKKIFLSRCRCPKSYSKCISGEGEASLWGWGGAIDATPAFALGK